jgi:hypothetical protein
MNKLLLPSLGLIASLILSQHTLALTFKTGEVIGPDGKSYVGISPQNKARMLANIEPGEIKSGVMNKHFYLVYNNQLVTVPVTELRNKTTAERMTLIKQAITTEGGVQLSSTGQSPTLSAHMDSDMDNATQEVEHSLDSEIQEANDHLENELSNGLERDLDSVFDDKFDNEVSDHLESDLEHDLNDALGHDFENEINDQLENDHTFDRVDNDDRNESHDDNDSHDSHDSNDDHDDD